ncbi:MAG: nucleoside-diphosphate kinase [Gammaproteobacteria bacterium]
MSIERTLSIIKPNAVKDRNIGEIYHRFERNNLTIVAAKMMHLTEEQAGGFYAEHKERPFYGELVEFMMSEPVMVQVLEGEDAVSRYRNLMGATDPQEAAPGTIRAELAEFVGHNTVHGSDSSESAEREINFFFKPEEIVSTY